MSPHVEACDFAVEHLQIDTHTHLKTRSTEGGVGIMGDGTCYIIVAIGCVDMKRNQLSKRYRSPFVGNESLSNQE